MVEKVTQIAGDSGGCGQTSCWWGTLTKFWVVYSAVEFVTEGSMTPHLEFKSLHVRNTNDHQCRRTHAPRPGAIILWKGEAGRKYDGNTRH